MCSREMMCRLHIRKEDSFCFDFLTYSSTQKDTGTSKRKFIKWSNNCFNYCLYITRKFYNLTEGKNKRDMYINKSLKIAREMCISTNKKVSPMGERISTTWCFFGLIITKGLRECDISQDGQLQLKGLLHAGGKLNML